jgi:hypothetical protein
MKDPLSAALILLIPVSLAALIYIWYLGYKDGRDSKVYKWVVIPVTTLLWLSAAYFCTIAAFRLEHGVAAVPEWTVWLTTSFGIFLAGAVIYKAIFFRSQR